MIKEKRVSSNLIRLGILVSSVLVIIGIICTSQRNINDSTKKYIRIGDAVFLVDVMDTESERQRGLSKKTELCPNCGMLFVFDKVDIYQFWMKDMYFDIDVVWIRDNEVVEVRKSISHAFGEQEIFAPHAPVDHVMELPAGTIDAARIVIGQRVSEEGEIFE
jgi:uncharacterized membrane protein (UPF0127 family)